MITTIQISEKLLSELKKRKAYAKESYEDIIRDLLEDTVELSDETKRNIALAEKEIKEGKIISHEQLKKEMDLSYTCHRIRT